MRSVIPYFGGKDRQASWIIDQFPPTNQYFTYCEIFGGGGSVLLQKPPSSNEIYNDIDTELVNFLMILRDQPAQFYTAVDSLPVARSLYERYKWEPMPEDPFQRAVRWWYIARNGFGGVQRHKTGWKHSKAVNCAQTYYSSCKKALQMADRFRNVQIECLDFRDLIPMYESPKTVFYADPPYRGREIYYHGDFNDQDHNDLANILSGVKGKVIISYYEDEMINNLYKDWFKVTKNYALLIEKTTETRLRAKEVLYLNFEPVKELTLFEIQER